MNPAKSPTRQTSPTRPKTPPRSRAFPVRVPLKTKQPLAYFKELGKRTSTRLAVMLVTAYAEDASQKARNLLYDLWPDADWDGFVRENLGTSVPMCIKKEAA